MLAGCCSQEPEIRIKPSALIWDEVVLSSRLNSYFSKVVLFPRDLDSLEKKIWMLPGQ